MSDGEAQEVTAPETTPERRIVIPPDKRDARGRFLPGVPKSPNWDDRSVDIRAKRWEAHSAGIRAGLRAAAAELEGKEILPSAIAAAVYAKEIGKGVLANAMERPHDAARAYVSMAKTAGYVSERGDNADQNVSSISVTVSGPIAEALLAWRAGRQDVE